ncbi:MAG TPA: hypothetical protein VG734_21740 [Lacunisphaera sp.]|nr:hypothetical protein [Lacunisphaera sp.]
MNSLPRLLVLSAVLLAATALASESKPAAPAAKPAPAPAVSAAGTWHLEIQTSQGTGTPTFTFKQDGENLTGQYKGLFGEAPVTGTLKGADVTFSVKVKTQDGQELTIAYAGTIDGDAMKGKVTFGSAGEGAFTGKRSAN